MFKNNDKYFGLGLIFNILKWLVYSWFLTHFLAFFGIFFAVSYPVWWLFIPDRTICFSCRVLKAGEYCRLCHRTKNNGDGIFPKTILSSVGNGSLILIFSLISLGVVYLESQLLFKLGFPPTPKTVSFVIPNKGQYRIGEIFPVKINITGIKTPINSVQADLGFDSSKVSVQDISTEGSFANIFIQKELNNNNGYARLTGGLPSPGFFADHGFFGTAYFKALTPGVVKIEFLPTSMVLANDKKGTNVLKDFASVSYLILPEEISKEEYELQKEISLNSSVLGENSENTQIKFYEENRVLGDQAEKEIQIAKKFNLFRLILNGFEKIDRFILDIWGKIINIF